jgi:NAD(P)H-nitrite reductase large subunit
MDKKKENLPEKGAAVQRDMDTYAIIPYIAGGILDPATLRKIADVAEKYEVKIIKMNSEHRIGFMGLMKRILKIYLKIYKWNLVVLLVNV